MKLLDHAGGPCQIIMELDEFEVTIQRKNVQ